MRDPSAAGASLPHREAIEQSLRFAGVDAATAGRIAQAGPNGLYPDLGQVFQHNSPAQLGAYHGHPTNTAQTISAAAYTSQTQIALHSTSPSLHTAAHEVAHVLQQSGARVP